MTEHRFTLILAGNLDEHLDDLFEAGCDDATVGSVDGVHFAEFDREASSLTEALASAISAVESVPTLRVQRIEPDDLVTASDIADRLARSRESVRLLVAGQRGPGGFPSPVSHLRARNRLWRWSEVAAWAGAAGSPPADDARVIAALNAALELRAASPLLLDDTRSLVRSLESSAA